MKNKKEPSQSRILYFLLLIIVEFITVYFISYSLYLRYNPVEPEAMLNLISFVRSNNYILSLL